MVHFIDCIVWCLEIQLMNTSFDSISAVYLQLGTTTHLLAEGMLWI